MTDELPDPKIAACAYARDLVRTGFETERYIVQSVTECMEEYRLLELDSLVESSVENEIQSLLKEQVDWSHPTDCERLDQAFDDLKSRGIIAQHHYTCCGTCGMFEIDLHLKYESKQGRQWRGYTFYHVQDTESAIHGNGQFLYYGSSKDDQQESILIGHEIMEVLKDCGFDPQWDGSIEKRIFFDMSWQRPWPPKVPDVVPKGALDMYRDSLKPSKLKALKVKLKQMFGNKK